MYRVQVIINGPSQDINIPSQVQVIDIKLPSLIGLKMCFGPNSLVIKQEVSSVESTKKITQDNCYQSVTTNDNICEASTLTSSNNFSGTDSVENHSARSCEAHQLRSSIKRLRAELLTFTTVRCKCRRPRQLVKPEVEGLREETDEDRRDNEHIRTQTYEGKDEKKEVIHMESNEKDRPETIGSLSSDLESEVSALKNKTNSIKEELLELKMEVKDLKKEYEEYKATFQQKSSRETFKTSASSLPEDFQSFDTPNETDIIDKTDVSEKGMNMVSAQREESPERLFKESKEISEAESITNAKEYDFTNDQLNTENTDIIRLAINQLNSTTESRARNENLGSFQQEITSKYNQDNWTLESIKVKYPKMKESYDEGASGKIEQLEDDGRQELSMERTLKEISEEETFMNAQDARLVSEHLNTGSREPYQETLFNDQLKNIQEIIPEKKTLGSFAIQLLSKIYQVNQMLESIPEEDGFQVEEIMAEEVRDEDAESVQEQECVQVEESIETEESDNENALGKIEQLEVDYSTLIPEMSSDETTDLFILKQTGEEELLNVTESKITTELTQRKCVRNKIQDHDDLNIVQKLYIAQEIDEQEDIYLEIADKIVELETDRFDSVFQNVHGENVPQSGMSQVEEVDHSAIDNKMKELEKELELVNLLYSVSVEKERLAKSEYQELKQQLENVEWEKQLALEEASVKELFLGDCRQELEMIKEELENTKAEMREVVSKWEECQKELSKKEIEHSEFQGKDVKPHSARSEGGWKCFDLKKQLPVPGQRNTDPSVSFTIRWGPDVAHSDIERSAVAQ